MIKTEVIILYNFQRIRDLREDADLKQKEIAAILEIDQRVYSNYEIGKREIPVHLLIKLADYYNTTTDYILGRTNKK
ncbi:MAG: helix-turn-helix domain-containing protein [Eubacterium sp.]